MNEPASPEPERDLDLEPMRRDGRFLVRLVLALLVGAMAATVIGWKMHSLAASCGAGIIRPGGSVIPAE
jgi:hypothetical protein